jgi:lipopolysaccharide/colanic/teichoic acid biosynthesis glycosyltransferase
VRWSAIAVGPGVGPVTSVVPGPEARRAYSVAKRSFDLALASILLVLVLPLWIAIVLAIVTTSPGPALFRQRRCGRRGKPFTCYKFRTMAVGAEAILRTDPSLREEFVGNWKLGDDPRVTRVGRWLRKSSLDEVPQLLNILKGEMSFVGPRPVQPNELGECYGAAAAAVFDVLPGLTGLWQVSGRSNLSYAQRVALDLEYVRRRGFWFDCQIVLRTVPAILMARGAC